MYVLNPLSSPNTRSEQQLKQARLLLLVFCPYTPHQMEHYVLHTLVISL